MQNYPIKVLVIDDDEDDFIIAEGLFEDIKGGSYEVVWISNYDDGLREVRTGKYDVALVDFRLSAQNGLDLIRQMSAEDCVTPAILMTGQGDKEVDIEAMNAGAADYLVKGKVDSLLLEKVVRYTVRNARAEAALRASEARFRSVVQHSSDVITILDSESKIIYTSPSVEKLFGYGISDFAGKKLTDFVNSEDAEKLTAFLGKVEQKVEGVTAVEWRIRHLDDSYHYVESVGTNLLADPNVGGIVITTRNINERKNLESQLAHQAFHDPLTGLANRVLFRDRVEHILRRASRNKMQVAVLFLDLDNFKNVNDSLGHAAGDELLMNISHRICQCVRATDTVSRLGGDEFAVLLEDTEQPEQAIIVAERILKKVSEYIRLNTHEVSVGISIGIAVGNNEYSADELLRNADVAMYIAKAEGKGRYAVFESEMHKSILTRIELEKNLRRALDEERFLLYYQPIVNLRTEEVVGFEALVRWQDEHGVVLPPTFIPIAEETGLIVPIGRWVIAEACREACRLQEKYGKHLTMTVNISSRQFQHGDFVSDIAEAVGATGIKPSSLILEITESVMMQNTEAMLMRLREVKKLGVQLAIDDFGTGYSSLSYLQQFPIDILKIDRSFIAGISERNEKPAVARTIISLSNALQLSTIAEGIETAEHFQAVKQLGSEFGQGFYFSKPMPPENIAAFLETFKFCDTPDLGIISSVNVIESNSEFSS